MTQLPPEPGQNDRPNDDSAAFPGDGGSEQQTFHSPQGDAQPTGQAAADDQQGYASQPEYPQPEYAQPQYAQPEYAQPQYPQPAFVQPGPQHPGYPQPSYPQPSYSQPGHGAAGQYGQVAAPMNVLAILGFIGVFFFGLVGIILGHISLSQIKRTGERGRGLALAATIIGYARIVVDFLAVMAFLTFLGLFGAAASGVGSSSSGDYNSDYFDDGDHGSFDGENDGIEDFYADAPWVGTANEGFCAALINPSDPLGSAAYFENLMTFTNDPELIAMLEAQAKNAETAPGDPVEDSKEWIDNFSEWNEASAELRLACLGADETR